MTGSSKDQQKAFVSLSEAATRAGRSVRTVQRWIEDGQVESVQDPTDRRRRLVSSVGLERMRQREGEGRLDLAEERRRREVADRTAIMEAARAVDRYASAVSGALGQPRPQNSDDELGQSPFVQDLHSVFAAVNGDHQEPPDVVGPALERVLRVLHTDPLTGKLRVPDEFWGASLVGRNLARARLLFYPPQSLVTLNEIVEGVGLPRSRVENILRAFNRDRVYDPDDQRWLFAADALLAVRIWNARLRGRPADDHGFTDVGPLDHLALEAGARAFLPIENRDRFRTARREYQRRHFPGSRR